MRAIGLLMRLGGRLVCAVGLLLGVVAYQEFRRAASYDRLARAMIDYAVAVEMLGEKRMENGDTPQQSVERQKRWVVEQREYAWRWAAARTMRARVANRCAEVGRLVQSVNFARSSAVRVMGVGFGPRDIGNSSNGVPETRRADPETGNGLPTQDR